MLYQLPNGKVIQLSIDQYLALTDQDLQYLVAINYGETITSPWYNSVISDKHVLKIDKEDTSIDCTLESEDIDNIDSSISTEDLIDNVEYPTTNFEE